MNKTGVVRTSCTRAKFIALVCGFQKYGSGAPNMCPIVKYISGTKKQRDARKRVFKFFAAAAKPDSLFSAVFSCGLGSALPSSMLAP